MRKSLIKLLRLPKNARVLDLGCGLARNRRYFKNYVGIDIEPRAKGIIQADFSSWILKNKKKFHLIINEYSMQAVKNPKIVMKNVLHSLYPGGYFYLASFNKKERIGRPLPDLFYKSVASQGELLYKRTASVKDRPHFRAQFPHRHFITELIVRKTKRKKRY